MHSLTQLCILLCHFFFRSDLLFTGLGDVKAVAAVRMTNEHAVDGERLCDVTVSEDGWIVARRGSYCSRNGDKSG